MNFRNEFRTVTQNMTLGLPFLYIYPSIYHIITRMNATIPLKLQAKVHFIYLDICIKRPRKGSKTPEKKINIITN